MDLKRIFRGWVLAIIFVAIILVILYKLVNTGPEYKLVPHLAGRRSDPAGQRQVGYPD